MHPAATTPVMIAIAKGATVFEKHVALPTDKYAANAYSATPEQVRAAKQMSAIEMSLDAPVDRSDREACTLGER